MMHGLGGMLSLHSVRVHQQVVVSVLAYQPDPSCSKGDLQQRVSSVLSEFALTATTGWPCNEPVGGRAVGVPIRWELRRHDEDLRKMSNVLDLYDQTMFLGERATGVTSVLQCVWMYNRAIDIDGLRRFHHHLQRGRLSRRIERSPLPFGRHRWVASSNQSELEIVEKAVPRAEFDAWLSEQANTPLDAERGPGWHLAVLPFTDGGAGVTLVTTHCLTDGVGLCEQWPDAASGRHDPISWPAAGHRRWRACARTPSNRARHPRYRPSPH
jgi:hypothetical protein